MACWKRRILLAALSFTAPLLPGLALADDPATLRAKELKSVLIGNTLVSQSAAGSLFIYYPDAGTIWGRTSSGDVDVGRWWIANDLYCRAWRRWMEGAARCWHLALTPDRRLAWLTPEMEMIGYSALKSGNALGAAPQLKGPAAQAWTSARLGTQFASAGPEPESGLQTPGGKESRGGAPGNAGGTLLWFRPSSDEPDSVAMLAADAQDTAADAAAEAAAAAAADAAAAEAAAAEAAAAEAAAEAAAAAAADLVSEHTGSSNANPTHEHGGSGGGNSSDAADHGRS